MSEEKRTTSKMLFAPSDQNEPSTESREDSKPKIRSSLLRAFDPLYQSPSSTNSKEQVPTAEPSTSSTEKNNLEELGDSVENQLSELFGQTTSKSFGQDSNQQDSTFPGCEKIDYSKIRYTSSYEDLKDEDLSPETVQSLVLETTLGLKDITNVDFCNEVEFHTVNCLNLLKKLRKSNDSSKSATSKPEEDFDRGGFDDNLERKSSEESTASSEQSTESSDQSCTSVKTVIQVVPKDSAPLEKPSEDLQNDNISQIDSEPPELEVALIHNSASKSSVDCVVRDLLPEVHAFDDNLEQKSSEESTASSEQSTESSDQSCKSVKTVIQVVPKDSAPLEKPSEDLQNDIISQIDYEPPELEVALIHNSASKSSVECVVRDLLPEEHAFLDFVNNLGNVSSEHKSEASICVEESKNSLEEISDPKCKSFNAPCSSNGDSEKPESPRQIQDSINNSKEICPSISSEVTYQHNTEYPTHTEKPKKDLNERSSLNSSTNLGDEQNTYLPVLSEQSTNILKGSPTTDLNLESEKSLSREEEECDLLKTAISTRIPVESEDIPSDVSEKLALVEEIEKNCRNFKLPITDKDTEEIKHSEKHLSTENLNRSKSDVIEQIEEFPKTEWVKNQLSLSPGNRIKHNNSNTETSIEHINPDQTTPTRTGKDRNKRSSLESLKKTDPLETNDELICDSNRPFLKKTFRPSDQKLNGIHSPSAAIEEKDQKNIQNRSLNCLVRSEDFQNTDQIICTKCETVNVVDTKKIMTEISEEQQQLRKENSELRIQLNAAQQAKASLELEVMQKEEIIIKTQAQLLDQELNYKLEIKNLKEKMKESTSEKDSTCEQRLKAAEEAVAEMQTKLDEKDRELRQKLKDEIEYQRTMAAYEELLKERQIEYEKLFEDHKITETHFTNLELAFSDVHAKYEKTKELLKTLKENEELLRENLIAAHQANSVQEEKYDSLKAHAQGQIDKSNRELLLMKQQYDEQISKLKAVNKRFEIKCKSIEVALEHKNEECKELAALCDEVTGKKL